MLWLTLAAPLAAQLSVQCPDSQICVPRNDFGVFRLWTERASVGTTSSSLSVNPGTLQGGSISSSEVIGDFWFVTPAFGGGANLSFFDFIVTARDTPGSDPFDIDWFLAPPSSSGTCTFNGKVTTGPQNGTLTAGNYDNSILIGDPVNSFTGELVLEEAPDLSLGGPLPLFFQRYYASGMVRDSLVHSTVGQNWMHNFDLRLIRNVSAIKVVFHRGRQINFFDTFGNSKWDLVNPIWWQQGLPNIPFQLVQNGNNYILSDPRTGLQYTFDGVNGGRLTTIADRNGNTLTCTYVNQLLTQVSDGRGRTLIFTYTTLSHLETASDGTRTVGFAYNAARNLVRATNALNKVITYNYEGTRLPEALITSIQEPRGNVRYNQVYDANGRVTSQTDSRGHTTAIAYNGLERTITDPLNKQWVHTYDAVGNLLSLRDPDNQTANLAYNFNNQRAVLSDRLGDTTQVDFHPDSGRISALTNSLGEVVRFTWQPVVHDSVTNFDLVQITLPDNAQLNFNYDAQGNLLTATDRAGNVSRYRYSASGQVERATNRLGGVTVLTYNADGTLAGVQDPASNTETFAYDTLRRPTRVTHPDATYREVTYDALDRVLTARDESASVRTFTYDDNGNLSTSQNPVTPSALGRYDYNNDDRLRQFTNRLDQVVQYDYDGLGRLNASTNAAGDTVRRAYTPLNRLSELVNGANKTNFFAYDSEGILTRFTNALSQVWTTDTDKLGRPVRVTSPVNAQTGFAYDNLGRLTSVANPLNHITSIEYDAQGLTKRIVLPNGIAAGYARNAEGQVTRVTNGVGQVWVRAYDSSGRLTATTDPLSRAVNREYDHRNRLTNLTATLGSMRLVYDDASRVTSAQFSDATALNFTYDANGRLLAANNGSFTYDAEGRMTACNGLAITRDAVGRIASITLAPGKSVIYQYDARGLVTQVTDWVGGSTSLTYDDAGRLTTLTRPAPGGIMTTYTYDNANRLTRISESTEIEFSITLTRDLAGRITSADRNLPTSPSLIHGATAFAHDAADQLTGGSFSYDSLGRRTADDRYQYTWDLASRVTTLTPQGGNAANLTYDGLGHVVGTDVPATGEAETYVLNYALGLPCISVVRTNGMDARYYVHLPGGRLLHLIEADNTRRFYHFDEAGTTTFLSDHFGNVKNTYGLTPFGELISRTGTTEQPFTFHGAWGVYEVANGLYQMRARWYDAKTASFISRDPVPGIGPKSINPYQFAFNNPVRFADPRGLFPGAFSSLAGLFAPIRGALQVVFLQAVIGDLAPIEGLQLDRTPPASRIFATDSSVVKKLPAQGIFAPFRPTKVSNQDGSGLRLRIEDDRSLLLEFEGFDPEPPDQSFPPPPSAHASEDDDERELERVGLLESHRKLRESLQFFLDGSCSFLGERLTTQKFLDGCPFQRTIYDQHSGTIFGELPFGGLRYNATFVPGHGWVDNPMDRSEAEEINESLPPEHRFSQEFIDSLPE